MSKKSDATKRLGEMFQKLNKFIPAYKVLKQYVNPFRGRFDNDNSDVGSTIDHSTLIRSHATHAVNIFASGLNSGMTNKASQWFKVGHDDPIKQDLPGVRPWTDAITDGMYAVINRSNLYDAFFSCYQELGTFGTGCFLILPDFDDVIRAKILTAGEYMIGVNNKGEVDTFGRKFKLTVKQMVQEFGEENCSLKVQTHFERDQLDLEFEINHLIQPNKHKILGRDDKDNMAFESLYWEDGAGEEDKFLAKRGHKIFRAVAPRWEAVTTDTDLGYGPSWHALGSIKELQKTAKDKLMAQQKLHDPPTIEDASVDGHSNMLPGGTTKVTGTVPNSGVRPAYQINPNLDSFIELMNDEKAEIDKFFFVNLFLTLIDSRGEDKTATEVAGLNQEKMMMMGPALHRLDKEMLTKALEIVFHDMAEIGMIPEPPQEIRGDDLKVEFTSILAQAQKATGITKVERVVALAGAVYETAQIADILDADTIIREVNEMEGGPSKILFEQAVLQANRKAAAERAQQQQQTEAMPGMAKAAKDASEAELGKNSALDKMMEQQGG